MWYKAMRAILLGVLDKHLDIVKALVDSLFLYRHVGCNFERRRADRFVYFKNFLFLLLSSGIDCYNLRMDDVQTAGYELVFKDWNLILHSEINIYMQL